MEDNGSENENGSENDTGTATVDATVQALMGEFLLKPSEVARLLRVPEATIENLHRTGQLKAIRCGKHKRWKPQDVRDWVQGLASEAVS